jgi:hypothetical protein
MTRWLVLAASGCLIVNEPSDDDESTAKILPIGDVHPCTVELAGEAPAHWTVCFASNGDVDRFTHELMDNCLWNGTECVVECSLASLHPCVLACPGTGIPKGCNATHGCYCPADG